MKTFKKIDGGTLEEMYAYAKMYREHVKSCVQCRHAEEKPRVYDHRCDRGNELFARALP